MERLDGKTFNVVENNIEKLKKLFPEVVTENKIDMDKLRLILGEPIEKEKERYEFTWNGKTEAIQLAQKQTTGTLRPCKKDSVNWDTTENLYIEGDNLEVLRILQNSYRNKIKVIYIDPPYNTGKDFIYRDDFHDNIKSYKNRLQENMKSNAETSGRFHTDWLNMMYPRLKIARNLLTDDGVIFISIDENELLNLRKICDEIFGEHNFIGEIIVQSNPRGSQSSKHLATVHEYLLMYSKNADLTSINGFVKSDENVSEYKEVDENGRRYRLLGLRQRGGAWRREDRPKMYYPIYVNPENGEVSLEKSEVYSAVSLPKRPSGEESRWTWGKEKLLSLRENIVGRQVNREGELVWDIFRKDYLEDEEGKQKTQKPKTIWDDKEFNYQNARNEIKELFANSEFFDFPKPVHLIKKCIEMVEGNDFIVLDFFSGSATTAQAVFQKNLEDDGNRTFILVQLPEEIREESEAFKAGYRLITDLGEERIVRSGKKFSESNRELDVGFRVFSLDSTNLKEWEEETDNLERQLLDLIDPLKEGRSQEDVVYEILLKYGVPITVPIERINIEDKSVYSVGSGFLVICLERDLTLKQIEEIAKTGPSRIVFYDEGFLDDTVRTNSQQILKRYGVEDIRVL